MLGSVFHSLSLISSSKEVTPQELRQGQVINGKVLKIYPNNHALVRLAGVSHVAQMDLPLDVDTAYLFQVSSMGKPLKLKMISPFLEQDSHILLERLGLPTNTFLRNLALQLLKEQLPFDKNILLLASKWSKETDDPDKASQIILKMIREQWPLKQEVFQALFDLEKGTNNLSHSFLSVLEENIHKLTGDKKASVSHLLSQLGLSRNSSTIQWINDSVSHHQEVWNQLTTKLNIEASALQQDNGIKELLEQMQNIVAKQLGLSQKEVLAFQRMTKNIVEMDFSATTMKDELFTYLSQSSFQKFLKTSLVHLSSSEKETLSNLFHWSEQKGDLGFSSFLFSKENSEKIKDLFTSIQSLLSQQLEPQETRIMMPLLANLSTEKESLTSVDFLVRLKNYLQLSGIDYEHEVVKNKEGQLPETIKSALLSLSAVEMNDQVKKALQIFTGLQLLFQAESHHQIQWNFLLPGPVFQLTSDAFIQISGRKNKDKEIDSDHCSILFYLELEQIKETVIHMEIQNRRVQVKVYNKNANLIEVVNGLKASLKEGLGALGYDLTQVQVITGEVPKAQKNRWGVYNKTHPSGVDFTV